MSTEVGSLSASLTLDLSAFQGGMAEATQLAAQLSAQLQQAFSDNDNVIQMSLDILDLVEQIKLLQGSIEAFEASMRTMSGADLFAQIRTHTAALPSELARVTSVIGGINTQLSTTNASFQTLYNHAQSIATSLQGINLSGLFTGTPPDLTTFTSQLLQAQTAVSTMVDMLRQLGNVDISTGEVLDGLESIDPSVFGIIRNNIREIYEALNNVLIIMRECDGEAREWAQRMAHIATITRYIGADAREVTDAFKDSRGATKLNKQTGAINKNLQTAKGYAISVRGILGGIVVSQAFYKLLNIMEELVNGAKEFSTNMQDASVAYRYLMAGQDTSAGAFLNALKDIALQSPLDTTDLTAASRKLMAMGFSAKATVPALQILTDTAAVFSNGAGDMADQIDHIALAFGQMLASGKVSAQELRQLYNAGLPIYDLLSKGLGITMEQAKNIGKLGVDSATAVTAVLKQLQERYNGAAKSLSMTMSGAIEVIRESLQQLLSYAWAKPFDELTVKMGNVAKMAQALVKITQAYGPGGLFQAIFPEKSWKILRTVIAGFMQIGAALASLGKLLASIYGGSIGILTQVGAVVLPLLGSIARAIIALITAAYKATPALRLLLSMIGTMVICVPIIKLVTTLAKAIWTLTGAKTAAAAIGTLWKSMVAFGRANPVALGVILAISVALLAVVASSEKARAALKNFFSGISSSASGFGQNLDFGFDADKIAMPEFEAPDTADFSAGLDDLIAGMEDLGDATEKTGKKAKKNLQSFDEAYTIDPKDNSDAASGLADLASQLADLSKLDYSNLFDWTGDWASDWAKLSAGLGDLGDMTGGIFDNMSEAAKNLWNNLADALKENPTVTGGLLGAAIGAVIGGLFGGKGGALIGAGIGTLIGSIVGTFWPDLADKLKEKGINSTAALSAAIGAVLGAAIGVKKGGLMGGALGLGIGALAGWLISAIAEGIETGDWTGVIKPISVGLGAAIGAIAGGPVGAGIGAAIGGLVGWLAELFIAGFTTGEWDFSSISTIIGTGLGAAIGGIVGGPAGAAIGTAIGALIGWIAGKFIEADWSKVGEAFMAPWASLGEGLKNFWDDLWEPISEAWEAKDWGELGKNIILGVIKGILNIIPIITATIATFFQACWDAICTLFGIHSPATEMEPLGENILLGVLEGILNIIDTIAEWLSTNVFEPIYNWFTEHFTLAKFKEFGSNIITGAKNGITSIISSISEWLSTNVFTPIHTWFTEHFTLTAFKKSGENVVQGPKDGISSKMSGIGEWLKTSIWDPIKEWFSSNFTISNFLSFGSNIIQGVKNGITNMIDSLGSTVSSVFTGVKNTIKNILGIHSPSKVTTEFGEYMDLGFIRGLQNKLPELTKAASTVAGTLTDALQPEDTELGDMDLITTTDGSLTALTSWSTTFTNVVAETFYNIETLFDSLEGRITAATENLSTIPVSMDAQINSLSAVDKLATPKSAPTGTTGTITQIMADLTDIAIEKLSTQIASHIYEYIAPLFASLSSSDQDRAIAYIGTLIADDRGLKELERKLRVIQLSEGRRG